MSVESRPGTSEKSTFADVVIVGGGLSGLTTAYKLAKLGVDFQLLEARDRFGGRILTLESVRSSARFDLGPSWFWPGQEHIKSLIKELGLDDLIFTQYSSGDAVFEPQGSSLSAPAPLQRGISGISMAGSYRLQGGLSALIDALVVQIGLLGYGDCLHQSSTVSAITKVANTKVAVTKVAVTKLSDKVCVSYSQSDLKGDSKAGDRIDSEILCRHLVIASPVRALLESVKMDPQLGTARQAELEAVSTWMAGHSKVVVEYEKPFWRESGFSGDVISQVGPMSEIHDASSNGNNAELQAFALFGFLGVAPAARKQLVERLPDLILAQLVRIFGDQAISPLKLVIQDWAAEPLTASKHDQLIPNHHPVNHWSTTIEPDWSESLIWSGTETVKGHTNGYLEGAVIASKETVRQLESLLELI
ncbi:MAG: monoamine oxidase [Arenicella sp.]|jgi:monoamine oxidase